MSKFRDEADDYALKVLGQSTDAWYVSDEEMEDGLDESDFWLPKSQVEVTPTNPKVGTVATFTVPNWLAEEKGLI